MITWATKHKQSDWKEIKTYLLANQELWHERLIWLLIGATLFITAERLYWIKVYGLKIWY